MAAAKEPPAEAPAVDAQKVDEPMVTVTVAPGRSMREPVPNGVRLQNKFRGTDAKGMAVYESIVVASQQRMVMPGQTLQVKASSVAFLVDAGFILEPEA
jgi:hypothetical protein